MRAITSVEEAERAMAAGDRLMGVAVFVAVVLFGGLALVLR